MPQAIASKPVPDIEVQIRTFLIQHFLSGRAESLRDDGSLLGNVVDSLGVLDLVTYLQDQFHISVEDEDVVPSNLDSVKNLAAFVTRKLELR